MSKSLREILGWEPPANDTDEQESDDDDDGTDVDTEPAIVETDDKMDDGEDGGPSSKELTARIDEIEAEVDSTSSSVRAVQSSQDELHDTVEEMNDTVRELLGVYDQVNAAQNPFVESGETYDNASPDVTVNKESATDETDELDAADESEDDVVSFDDLAEQRTEQPAVDETEAAGEHDDEIMRSGEPDTQSTESAAADGAGQAVSVEATSGANPATNESEHDAMVSTLPGGYAGDVLMMEWLAKLMEQSGPAGTLRAVEHYQTLNWVSPSVRDRALDCLGGPSLDVFVDPTQPCEPTGDDHALSQQYLTVLSELDEV